MFPSAKAIEGNAPKDKPLENVSWLDVGKSYLSNEITTSNGEISSRQKKKKKKKKGISTGNKVNIILILT
jgi:ribosome assembly protein YihI (activator of Der GTPase)